MLCKKVHTNEKLRTDLLKSDNYTARMKYTYRLKEMKTLSKESIVAKNIRRFKNVQ